MKKFLATEHEQVFPWFDDPYSTEERIEVSAIDVELYFKTAEEDFAPEFFYDVIVKKGQKYKIWESDDACDSYFYELIIIDME